MRGNLVTLGAVVSVILLVVGFHQVPEGHVGVYYRMGALLDGITDPGLHWKLPFTAVYPIQTTLQTDEVRNIPCGTSGGVTVLFEKIEVVNQLRKDAVLQTIRNYSPNYDQILIFQKIHHEINQFCSAHSLQEVYIDKFSQVDDRLAQALQEQADKWAPGLQIIAVRLTKPSIPPAISQNYEEIEKQKTRLLAAGQEQKVILKKAETEKMEASITAEKLLAVSKIKMEQSVNEKESAKKMQEIENDMLLAREKATTDADYYRRSKAVEAEIFRLKKTAEANTELLTAPYLQSLMLQAIANNTKIYFGPSIPSMFLESSAAGLFAQPAPTRLPKRATQPISEEDA